MNINATLFIEMIAFLIFILITQRFVWPHITKAMDDRQKKIADGIAAAEESVRKLDATKLLVEQDLRDARSKAAEIIEEANKRGYSLVEEAREKARVENERMINVAKAEIAQQVETSRLVLRKELADLTVNAAEKLLSAKIDQHANDALIEKLIAEMN